MNCMDQDDKQLLRRTRAAAAAAIAGQGLEQEEKQLLRRIRFSSASCKSKPPRPELGYTPLVQDNQLRPNFLERTRCAELANARSRFDPEPHKACVDLESWQ